MATVWSIVCVFCIALRFTSGKYVKAVISSPVALGINTLEIECATSYFNNDDTVYQIVLSKNQNESASYKLIAIEPIAFSYGFNTNVVWYQTDFKSRTVIITAKVYPADQANLRIKISSNNVLCSDYGSYICEVFASNGKNGRSESYLNITVGDFHFYKVTELTCVNFSGEYNIGHSAVLRCGGKVGNPPRIPKWCMQLANDTMLRPYRNVQKVAYTTLRQNECQYESYSQLEYTVSSVDDETTFSCVSTEDLCFVSTSKENYVIKKRKETENSVAEYKTCYRDVSQNQEIDCDHLQEYIIAVSVLAGIFLLFLPIEFFVCFVAYRKLKWFEHFCTWFWCCFCCWCCCCFCCGSLCKCEDCIKKIDSYMDDCIID